MGTYDGTAGIAGLSQNLPLGSCNPFRAAIGYNGQAVDYSCKMWDIPDIRLKLSLWQIKDVFRAISLPFNHLKTF